MSADPLLRQSFYDHIKFTRGNRRITPAYDSILLRIFKYMGEVRMVTNKHLDCSKVNMPFANISITNAFVKTTGLYLNSFYDTNYPNGRLVYEMIIGCPEMCMNTTRLVTDMYVVMSKTYETPFVSTLDEKTFGPNLDIRLYYDNILDDLGSQKGITSPYVYSKFGLLPRHRFSETKCSSPSQVVRGRHENPVQWQRLRGLQKSDCGSSNITS